MKVGAAYCTWYIILCPCNCQCFPYEPPTPDDHYLQLLSYVHGGGLLHVGIGVLPTYSLIWMGGQFLSDATRQSVDHYEVKFLRESGLVLEEWKHERKRPPSTRIHQHVVWVWPPTEEWKDGHHVVESADFSWWPTRVVEKPKWLHLVQPHD